MSNNQSKIFIICGVHNNLEDTKNLLNSLVTQTYTNYTIIIINDGSTDDTAEYIANNYPEITILPGDGNLWWTRSVNLGIAYVLKTAQENDYILTINNDCIVKSDYLAQLIRTAHSNPRTIIGSLVRDIHNRSKIVDAGIKIDWPKYSFRKLKIRKKKKFIASIDTLTTKGTLYPVSLVKDVGNFDVKHLPHYLSDYEYACRAKHLGYNLILDYQAVVYNDALRTGTISRATIFSRRSKVNLLDHLQFIRLCCPKRYKLACYFNLLKKGLSRYLK